MKAQAVNPDIKMELMEIGIEMHKSGLSNKFVTDAVGTAFEFEGVYDLMKLWSEEEDPAEQGEIVAEIQDLIIDCTQKEKVEGAYVRFDDLASIAKNIRGFKDSLRIKVDAAGGIGELAKKTGIPHPYHGFSTQRRFRIVQRC